MNVGNMSIELSVIIVLSNIVGNFCVSNSTRNIIFIEKK